MIVYVPSKETEPKRVNAPMNPCLCVPLHILLFRIGLFHFEHRK